MPFDHSRPYTFDRIVRIAITIGIFYGVITAMNYLSSVLIPFVLSLLIAYLLFPVVKFFDKRVFKNRIAAILTTLLLLTLIVSGGLALALPIVVGQVQKMSKLVTNLVNANFGGELPDYLHQVEAYILELGQREDVQEMLKIENIESLAKRILPGVYGILNSSLGIVLSIVGLTIILFYVIFILLDFEEITDGWQEFLPKSYRSTIVNLLEDFRDGMETYFRAQSIIVGIVSILFAVGFSLIGLPMGFLLGIFIGLLNFVPYLQNVGFLPATFLAVMHSLQSGDNFWSMMGLVLLVFAVVQLIQEALLTPKIMGDATGMNPAMILLSLTIWGKLMGVLGLLIALPMTSLLVSYYRRFIRKIEEHKHDIIVPDEMDEPDTKTNPDDRNPADAAAEIILPE